jgi:predicted ATPase
MGDGLLRVLAFASALARSPGGVVLIDEIENGLHYSVMTPLWSAIERISRQLNVQVFATTHSDEMLRAVVEAVQAAGCLTDLRAYRFDRSGPTTRVAEYSGELLLAADQASMEVR